MTWNLPDGHRWIPLWLLLPWLPSHRTESAGCTPSVETTRAVDIIILKNWNQRYSVGDGNDLIGSPEKMASTLVIAKKRPGHTDGKYMNLAGSYYRQCPQENDLDCTKGSLKVKDEEGGWCEAASEGKDLLKEGEMLDKGELSQMTWAMQKSTKGHLAAPPPGSIPMLGEDSDWPEMFVALGGIVRTPIKRIASIIRDSSTELWYDNLTDMTSMVYPTPSSLALDQLLYADGGIWLLGCKDALDPTVFHEADLMRSLNESLKLWQFGCPDTSPTRLTLPANNANHHVVIGLIVTFVLLGAFSIAGYLGYQQYIAQQASAYSQQGDQEAGQARQVEMTTALKKW